MCAFLDSLLSNVLPSSSKGNHSIADQVSKKQGLLPARKAPIYLYAMLALTMLLTRGLWTTLPPNLTSCVCFIGFFGSFSTPYYHYISCTAHLGLTNLALTYVNFVTQVIFKSSKLVPVMIGSSFCLRMRSYDLLDYCCAFVLVIGLCLFSVGDREITHNVCIENIFDVKMSSLLGAHVLCLCSTMQYNPLGLLLIGVSLVTGTASSTGFELVCGRSTLLLFQIKPLFCTRTGQEYIMTKFASTSTGLRKIVYQKSMRNRNRNYARYSCITILQNFYYTRAA